MSAIDEVKQRLDIVQVIEGYVKLQKAGRNFKALCPFHTEKTPSLMVSTERQAWHCFGCGASGDVFSFVMRKEGLTFGEALKALAERAGVTLSERRKASEDKQGERLREINAAAAQYFHQLLLNDPQAQKARHYLERRGLSRETIEEFQLGFSLDKWDALKGYLLAQGYGEEEQVAAGLLVERGDGGYDRFRNRIMFPVRDIKGRVLGFGSRALDDSTPKYLNSPQTAIFDKGGVLYGIDRAKGAIREKDRAIIVEGYMDVLSAQRHGMRNVVASMGTSLTARQIGLLKGLTKSITFALDPDVAGDEATWRAIEVCRQALTHPSRKGSWLDAPSQLDADIRILSLPQGKDPDDVIGESPETWQQLVDQAPPLIDHHFQAVISRRDLAKPEEKSKACEELMRLVVEMKDEVQRELYTRKASLLTGVSERTLAGIMARLRRSPQERRAQAEPPHLTPTSAGDPLEEYSLSLLLRYPELRREDLPLSADHFERSENREVFLAWQTSPNLSSLRESLEESLQEHLEFLVTRTLPPAGEREREQALQDCARRLEERRLRNLKAEEAWLMAEAEDEGVAALQEKGLDTNRELRDIFLKTARKKGRAEGRKDD